jgi:hypothetical protein
MFLMSLMTRNEPQGQIMKLMWNVCEHERSAEW